MTKQELADTRSHRPSAGRGLRPELRVAIRPEIHTYAGGLGVLAGDTARRYASEAHLR
jgi:hypothetical protein